MVRGLYTAYTGMLAQQHKMDLVSNNLANINTAGYKKDQAILGSFHEMMMHRINDQPEGLSKRIGSISPGARVEEVYTDHTQGTMQQTDDPLNIAIQGSGMIAVGDLQEDGSFTERYTRDGSFTLDQEGFLMTKDGYRIMSIQDEPLQVSGYDIRISTNGSVYQGENLLGQIKLVDFEDTTTLRKQGDSLYNVTDQSVIVPFTGRVDQGFLEVSNVNSVEEMINMINVMRTYEANQKVITTYDATLEKSVNSIGAIR